MDNTLNEEIPQNEELIASSAQNEELDAVSAELEADSEDEQIEFDDLGLDEITLEAIKKKGFIHPSPIQVLAIPRLLNGEANVIARARTGTGKTAAFGLPIVQSLREQSDYVKAIILEPTRELAMQTSVEMASFTSGKYPRSCVVYGGASIGEQIRQLKRGAEIVVGTPGRVQDLIDRGVLDISKIEYFILDEGDEMLDMGFVDDIEKIFSSAAENCRVLLFSATIPSQILKIAQKFMGDYEIVEEEGVVEEPLLIDQQYWIVRQNEKIEALVRLIDMAPSFYGLVFVQKKTDADYVCKVLDERGYDAAALHGDVPQSQREKILAKFRAKRIHILVATDVAARGIDIEGLNHVVNYELPFDGPTYVHRIGRTGRAGSSGNAVTFVRPEERRKLQFLKSAVKKSAKGDMKEGRIPSVEDVIACKKERLFDEVKIKIGLKDRNVDSAVTASQTSDDEKNVKESQMEQAVAAVAIAEEALQVRHLRKGDAVFDELAKELCEGQDAKDVVASLLAVTYGKELNANRYGKINSSGYSFKEKEGKGRGDRDFSDRRGGRDRSSEKSVTIRGDQMRLYVQLGWRDGYNPKKIAEYFVKLLKVRDRDVDAIDMADKFCLLNLPYSAAKKALELSKNDKNLPHMHQDMKAVVAKKTESTGKDRYAVARSEKSSRGDRGRSSDRRERDRGAKGGSHARPGVHTGTKRNSQASLYKKSAASENVSYY